MPWDNEAEEKVALENPYYCPVCKTEDCVPAAGDEHSDILLIGEFPGDEEINHGKPFVGAIGRLLKAEMRRLNLSLYSYRLCNLWLHTPVKTSKNKKKKENKGAVEVATAQTTCFEYGLTKVLKEADGKQMVVLIGSDTVKYFTGLDVSEWNGLLVQSHILNNPQIMAMMQPAKAFHSGIGELRFALAQFKRYVEEK